MVKWLGYQLKNQQQFSNLTINSFIRTAMRQLGSD